MVRHSHTAPDSDSAFLRAGTGINIIIFCELLPTFLVCIFKMSSTHGAWLPGVLSFSLPTLSSSALWVCCRCAPNLPGAWDQLHDCPCRRHHCGRLQPPVRHSLLSTLQENMQFWCCATVRCVLTKSQQNSQAQSPTSRCRSTYVSFWTADTFGRRPLFLQVSGTAARAGSVQDRSNARQLSTHISRASIPDG